MSPSMKVLRWILSHLTLITIVLVIMYFYWSWGNEEQEEQNISGTDSAAGIKNDTIKYQAIENQVIEKSPLATTKSRPATIKSRPATIKSHPEKAEPLPDPQGFSERMRQYQLKLSREERERLNSYDKAVRARNRTQVMGVKAVTEPKPVFPDEQAVLNKTAYPEPQEINNHSRVKAVTENVREPFGQKPVTAVAAVPSVEVPESAQQPVINDNLQKQIRSRQKQLSHQMISLLSATDIAEKSAVDMAEQTESVAEIRPVTEIKDNKPSVSFSVPEVKPVIKTAEQKKILAEARKALEQGEYAVAEEKYLRLAALLPELPDVMGELANVYRAQRRMGDYVAANTRFVKRLVNHYRFREAWRVVAETADVDKNASDKQRRIINNKQKQVETENFIQ